MAEDMKDKAMQDEDEGLLTFAIEDDEIGLRIDQYLADALEGVSRSQVQKWMSQGRITSQKSKGNPLKKNYTLERGDVITVQVPEPEVVDIVPENLPIDIVYEDDQVLVVNKPQGMVVHPAPGNYSGTLVNAILYHVKDLSDIGGVIRPGIVHRIDKDTSGLLMIAKTNLAHQSLSDQLREHSVDRVYVALVHGGFTKESGTVNRPIGRHPQNRLKMAIVERGGRDAITHYQVLERLGPYTLVECRLETGRTHQIRVHLAAIGHPLIGDPLYGAKKEKQKSDGQFLHAKVLGFEHPLTGERMVFSAPIPENFEKLLARLRNNR